VKEPTAADVIILIAVIHMIMAQHLLDILTAKMIEVFRLQIVPPLMVRMIWLETSGNGQTAFIVVLPNIV
jgi:hypothetical protein